MFSPTSSAPSGDHQSDIPLDHPLDRTSRQLGQRPPTEDGYRTDYRLTSPGLTPASLSPHIQHPGLQTESQDSSHPPPVYVTRPPPSMQPPFYGYGTSGESNIASGIQIDRGGPNSYYADVHQETQAPGQFEYEDPLHGHRNYGGIAPGTAASRRVQEDDYLQQSGQFNPEATGRNNKRYLDDDDEDRRGGECRSTLKEMAELCPCLCFCCIFMTV
ncbi:hypothetical protein EMPS_00855 [Entomortierella parvispora]|uniref:Uncharacterized protein n=1 Tax=Entomortierella parvispora TaxID=205924 RepID=A0A9P3H1W0_9FUNG|nr:hypothetical protein EMPS_00855 [Entomortierella parvispora]